MLALPPCAERAHTCMRFTEKDWKPESNITERVKTGKGTRGKLKTGIGRENDLSTGQAEGNVLRDTRDIGQ